MRKIENFSLFDWISVLERCSRLVTVDTSLIWLAEVFLKKTVPGASVVEWPTGQPSYGDLKSALRLLWRFAQKVSDLHLD